MIARPLLGSRRDGRSDRALPCRNGRLTASRPFATSVHASRRTRLQAPDLWLQGLFQLEPGAQATSLVPAQPGQEDLRESESAAGDDWGNRLPATFQRPCQALHRRRFGPWAQDDAGRARAGARSRPAVLLGPATQARPVPFATARWAFPPRSAPWPARRRSRRSSGRPRARRSRP